MPSQLASGAETEELVLKHQWETKQGADIDVEISERAVGVYTIKFSQGKKKLNSISTPPADVGSFPKSLFTLNDGNLVSLWTSGGPYFVLNIYHYKDGKVSRALRATSKMWPEFVNKTSVFSGINEVPGASQVIIISKTDWVSVDKSQGSKLIPTTADIYWWDETLGRYVSKIGVSWKKRLEDFSFGGGERHAKRKN